MTTPPPGRTCRATAPQASRAQPDPPRTLAALVGTGRAVLELEADAETLGLVLPLFARVSATTTGPHALLSERGGYGPVRLAGQGLSGIGKKISLRLTSGRAERVVLTEADPAQRLPAALHLFDAGGHLRHRAEIAAPEDLLVLASIADQLGAAPVTRVPEPVPAKPAQSSIPVIRRAQAVWGQMDARAHLDEIVLDGGQARSGSLRHLGGDVARPVPLDRLGPFLRHLAETRIAFRRSVPRPGCLQTHSGPAEVLPTGPGPVVLRSRASLFALDLAGVAACWVTQWQAPAGPNGVLELYDDSGHCLALLSAGSRIAREITLWNRLAALLPEA